MSLGLKVWSYHFYKLQDLLKKQKTDAIDNLLDTSGHQAASGGTPRGDVEINADTGEP